VRRNCRKNVFLGCHQLLNEFSATESQILNFSFLERSPGLLVTQVVKGLTSKVIVKVTSHAKTLVANGEKIKKAA